MVSDKSNTVVIPDDDEFKNNSAEILLNSIYGKFLAGVQGVHYKSNLHKNLEIIAVVNKPDDKGVWVANVKVYSEAKKQWFEKEESPFFPESWTPTEFLSETHHAIKNKKKVDGSYFRYVSETKSGVPVVIIIKNEKLSAIYPIYTIK